MKHRIEDNEVCEALKILEDRFYSYEQINEIRLNEVSALKMEIEDLVSTVEEYENKIKELEIALAEAYLTDEPDTDRREINQVQAGSRLDVPYSADNKAV